MVIWNTKQAMQYTRC